MEASWRNRTTLAGLDSAVRRRRVLASMTRMAVTAVLLVTLYGLLPAASQSGTGVVVKLVIGLVVFVLLLGWQVRTILQAQHPELRAAEALAVAGLLLIILFAFTYLSLSHDRPSNFSQPLNKISAVYFSVSILSTVGFGDITGKSDLARLLVTVQILLDFVLVFGIVRALLFAARIGVHRKQAVDAG